MRHVKVTLLFIFSVFTAFGQGHTCYGNSPCSACTTCNYCKHCNEGGGTCGVCSGNNSNDDYYKPKNYGGSTTYKYPSNKGTPSTTKQIGDLYQVTASTLNLRTGPGTSYSIITELPYGTLVSLQSTSGSWIKVKVISSNQVGYVYTIYIQKH